MDVASVSTADSFFHFRRAKTGEGRRAGRSIFSFVFSRQDELNESSRRREAKDEKELEKQDADEKSTNKGWERVLSGEYAGKRFDKA